MAKIDRLTSRATALAEDEPLDEFYRPGGTTSRSRPNRSERTPAGARDMRDSGLRGEDVGDLDGPDQEPFLRSRRRVAVRQGMLPRTLLGRVALALGVVATLAALVLLAIAVRDFLDHDPRFRIDSASNIQILGNSEVTRPELLSVFGSDIGRNIFFIPLSTRRAGLEHLSWVEHATVMRLLPNQLRIAVVERVPIAFVRVGNEIDLLDHDGVVLHMAPASMAAHHYSFAVVSGIAPGDPFSAREPRMHLYLKFLADLDSSGERLSEQLSEVDVADPEDIRAVVPAEGSDLLLHFGDQDFLSKFHSYQAHREEWRQQYPHLASIDLRDDPQVVLGMQKGYADAATAPMNTSPSDAAPAVTASTTIAKTVAKPAAWNKPTVLKPSISSHFEPRPSAAAAHAMTRSATAIQAARLRQQRAHAAARLARRPPRAVRPFYTASPTVQVQP